MGSREETRQSLEREGKRDGEREYMCERVRAGGSSKVGTGFYRVGVLLFRGTLSQPYAQKQRGNKQFEDKGGRTFHPPQGMEEEEEASEHTASSNLTLIPRARDAPGNLRHMGRERTSDREARRKREPRKGQKQKRRGRERFKRGSKCLREHAPLLFRSHLFSHATAWKI